MRILSVSRNGRELANETLTSPLVLIGRSPTCDLVLRAKGVRPVHFLVEWVGAGTFGEDEGVWTVFDISHTSGQEKDSGSQGAGEGVVIGEKPVKAGGFDFSFRTDRLHETTLKGGTLTESFQEKKMDKLATTGNYQLEVVSIREDSGSVSHVRHLDPIRGGTRRTIVPHVPLISVEWSAEKSGVPVNIDTSRLQDAKVYLGVAALLAGKPEEAKSAKLTPGELVQIQWQKSDHYFRLVPQIQVPPAPLSLFRDPFYRWALGTTVLLAGLFFALRNADIVPPEALKEPPRVAKIEIRNVDLKEMPPPPEPPVEPPPEEKPPEEKPKPPAPEPPKEKKAEEEPKKADSAPKAKLVKASKDKKTGGIVNSPAPKANVNSIGLLGALKPQKSGTVAADKLINEGIISNTASGKEGNIVVQQAPSGVVGKKTTGVGGLVGAYSKPTMGDSQSGSSVSQIAGTGHADGSDYKQSEFAASDEFTADGGLDKDSVRKTLAAYKRDIRTCYDRALMLNPKTGGRIVYKWRIAPTGAVEWINLTSNTSDSPGLASCVQGVIKGIRFPKAGNGKPTIVIYPFQFARKT